MTDICEKDEDLNHLFSILLVGHACTLLDYVWSLIDVKKRLHRERPEMLYYSKAESDVNKEVTQQRRHVCRVRVGAGFGAN